MLDLHDRFQISFISTAVTLKEDNTVFAVNLLFKPVERLQALLGLLLYNIVYTTEKCMLLTMTVEYIFRATFS